MSNSSAFKNLSSEQTALHISTDQQLAARWQISIKTLQANRRKEIGCRYFKAGRLVRYRIEDVLRFEQSNLHGKLEDRCNG